MVISYNTADKIRDRLMEFCTLFSFKFHGLDCDVDPFDETTFHLRCGDHEKDVHSIDAVMTEPFFDGQCLADIAGLITDVEG